LKKLQELWSPLLNAAKNGSLEIVKILIEAEADIEQPDVGNWTPLCWAVYKNRITTVEYLIESRADVNVVDEVRAKLEWGLSYVHRPC